MRKSMALVAAALSGAAAMAKIVTERVAYEHDGVKLEGFLAYDDARTGPRPAVIVVHEWWGLNDFAREKTTALAEIGYVAFAIDMFGTGVVTDKPEEAGKLSGQFRGKPELQRARAKAALDVLSKHERVDARRIGAIGFCFGGTTVMQMAFDGQPLAGVVSFHGGLPAISEDDARRARAKVLVLHGVSDTLIPPDAIRSFESAMEKGGADWQMVNYGGAKHSFMNPFADTLKMDGVGYDKRTADRAWRHMRVFFDEVLGPVE